MMTISPRGLRLAALFGFLGGLAWFQTQTAAFGQQIQLEPKAKPGFIDLLGPEEPGAKAKGQERRSRGTQTRQRQAGGLKAGR